MILGIVLPVALLLYVAPRLSRPGLFFGVTVDPAFARGSAARGIHRRYGLEIAVHSAIALALGLTVGPAIGLLWPILGGLWAFANAHRAAMPYASAENTIREAVLDPQREDSVLATALALAPLCLLALIAWYAQSHWDQIPERFPVHFGLRGPDAWVARSPRAVYSLIVVMGLICAFMLMTRYGLLHWSRRLAAGGAAAQAEARFRRVIAWLLIAVEYLMVALAWVMLFASPQAGGMLGIAMLVFTIAVVLVLLRMGQGGSRAAQGGPVGDRTPDACWKWGFFYVNPNDPALFVEKRFGIGYTVNLGNRWSWIFLLIPLLPLILLKLYLR
jgi:uncharacterized membrane protein